VRARTTNNLPDDDLRRREKPWLNRLTAKRREKLEEMLREKRKHDVDISLADCLNLGDMLELLERDKELRSTVGYHARGSCQKELSGLELLRNNVMHPSSSLVNNYDCIMTLRERKEKLQRTIDCIESAIEHLKQADREYLSKDWRLSA